jgi:hypothetical protein
MPILPESNKLVKVPDVEFWYFSHLFQSFHEITTRLSFFSLTYSGYFFFWKNYFISYIMCCIGCSHHSFLVLVKVAKIFNTNFACVFADMREWNFRSNRTFIRPANCRCSLAGAGPGCASFAARAAVRTVWRHGGVGTPLRAPRPLTLTPYVPVLCNRISRYVGRLLKGLSHQMDLAFDDDIYGEF